MASDISLAVGDGARRMTYAELAAVRGTSQASAERLVRRRGWPRQVGNDGVVRVLVPLTEARNVSKPTALVVAPATRELTPATSEAPPAGPGHITPASPGQMAPDERGLVRGLENAIEALREQLTKAAQREEAEHQRTDHQLELANRSLFAERARTDELQAALTEDRRRVEDGRKRIDDLHTALADAVAAERIAAGEASALRHQLDLLRARPWWRRWFR